MAISVFCWIGNLSRKYVGLIVVGNFYNSYMSMRRTKSETNIYACIG